MPREPMASRVVTRQACGLCRRRKVKCDGLLTCSNCRTAKAHCQYPTPKKRGPKPVQWQEDSTRASGVSLNSTSPVTSASGDSENPAIVQAYWSPDADSPLYSNSITSKAPSTPSESQRQTVVRTHLDLLAGLLVAAPSEAVASIPSRCILLYTQYVFGAIPLCHEGTLRATVSRFFNLPAGGADHSEDCAQISRCFAADSEQEWVAVLRSYTVLIALCAAVTYVLPESVLPNKHLTAPLFLRVARDTLRIYVDYDVEHPDSSSLSIRLFLSSAIQISTGMYGVAFHLLNEAGLTAMKLRLYDESSLEGKDPIEENILRNAFWQLYICDKTALVMRTRPVTIHESLFETGLTLKTHSRNYVPLLGAEPESNGAAGTEDRLVQGFHVIRRLWGMAARIIRAMEASSRKTLDEHADLHECRESTLQLSEEYFEMITWTNWVQTSEESSPDECRNGGHQLSQSLQRQRTAYLVSLHYIKVAVLNTAIQCNMTEIVGLSAGPLVLAMRQIELAQDFMNVIESVPFLHLQAEGEHCAEKIRRVGSLLLELAHTTVIDAVRCLAKQCAMRLIDMLARLNSKASDVLGEYIGS